ncbi:MAG: hypothetical protein COA92_05380 [Sulfurovum sp.]|nr:MAG: hypothetical protein COA92_05380 [Sulfurovum sp.]
MLATIDSKDARIEFKTSKDIKTLLQEAANCLGMDLSSFLISTATQRAKDVMIDDKILRLSKQKWENFEKELENPKPATKELKELMNMKGFDA